MEPPGAEATKWISTCGDGLHRSVALHHAALWGRPGLVVDDPRRPSSVVWLREGDGQWEAFAAGLAETALDWLAAEARGRVVALAAPASWEDAVRARAGAGRIEVGSVQTWLRRGPPGRRVAAVATRRLVAADAAAFAAEAPSWATRAWGDFAGLIERGAAFGVPAGRGFAALAWVFESDHHSDKIGVATVPRFRRLGLGRAAASALADHVERDRRKHPLWTTHADHVASIALARSLGFSRHVSEPLLRWTPQ